MTRLTLREDPYQIFHESRTPPGLYARQKWLRQPKDARWRQDFDATVAELYHGQSANGLWNGSALDTIHRLFGLHLTVRSLDGPIEAALDALLAMAAGQPAGNHPDDRIGAERLYGLPFAPGLRRYLTEAATLFLASIFGRQEDPAVLDLYRAMAAAVCSDDDGREDPALLNNRLRALVVQPRYATHAATSSAVEQLARMQTARGDWGREVPFFQTINALAHLDFDSADAQCRRAFKPLLEIQNADGSWGESEPEWCTFLVIHALRNKGAL